MIDHLLVVVAIFLMSLATLISFETILAGFAILSLGLPGVIVVTLIRSASQTRINTRS